MVSYEYKNKDSGFPIKNVGNDPRGERRWIPDQSLSLTFVIENRG